MTKPPLTVASWRRSSPTGLCSYFRSALECDADVFFAVNGHVVDHRKPVLEFIVSGANVA